MQLAPFGEYPQTREDGTTVKQICDGEAFQRLLENFSGGEIPVDFDHSGEEGGSTRAGAWVQRLWVDDRKGLMAALALTPSGEEAIVGREYRYLSPAWELREDGRPERLLSVAFTNKPNLPLSPVLNCRAKPAPNVVSNSNMPPQEGQTKTKLDMEKILEALGLNPEATEDDALGVIAALKDKIAKLEAERTEADAEAFANTLGEGCEDREAVKNAYKLCPEAARVIAKNIMCSARKPETSAIVNSRSATPPRSMAERLSGKSAEDVIAEIRKGL